MRDSQRQRCYDAENQIGDGRAYPTVGECQRRVDAIVGSKWWREHAHRGVYGPRSKVTVHDGRGHRNATSYGGTVALPKWARNDRVILHELAHEALPRGERHGP